ncbi:ABC transporter G family member 20-like [Brevipalpus obovatus]|uniref:ABC transporter G family member 20-like n=1 Tax=Brevipalpus obovatus TaxID=246614 RepID=UPI003D9E3A10
MTNEGVSVRNVCYGKGSVDILRNVYVSVPKAEIYCLLGPSGCGKTTLLRCIVGRLNPSDGDISLFGLALGHPHLRVPGSDVGYMPQEYALYDNLSIEENVLHFGRVTQMSGTDLKDRYKDLSQLFDLPRGDQLIRTLSGGQRRRVSLICCLIHKPKLAILDEPTAGLDPLLCQKIWYYLNTLAKINKTTVLITTHYIEEARRAGKIGFMRKGRLMVEGDPYRLMKNYKKKSLEDVFLQLCDRRRKSTMITAHELKAFAEMREESSAKNDEIPRTDCCLESPSKTIVWLGILFALIRTNIRIESRDPLSLMLQYVIPFVLMILAMICFGGSPIGIKLGYVNDDFGWINLGREYISMIDDRMVEKIRYWNTSEAAADAHSGYIWGYLHIPSNFDFAIARRATFNETLTDEEAINRSTIVLNADMSHKIVTTAVTRSLQNSLMDWIRKQYKDFNKSVMNAEPYITIGEPIYGEYRRFDDTGHRRFVMPGFVLNVYLAICMAISSISLISQRQSQTLERSMVCGVTSGQVLVSHMIARIILNVVFLLSLAYGGNYFLESDYDDEIATHVAILFLQMICGTLLGIFFASIFDGMSGALNIIAAVYIILLFTTGSIWPIESIPIGLRYIAITLPVTGSSEAYRSALYRGWSIMHPYIWPRILIACGWLFCFALIGFFLFKRAC